MASGNGLYRPSAGSGAPLQGVPGENGLGSILQNAIETSNVNVPSAMVEMISTQRAFEMNSKVMGVADQMWGSVNAIKQ